MKLFPLIDNVLWNDFAVNELQLSCCILEPLVCILTRSCLCVDVHQYHQPHNGSLFSIVSPALGCIHRNPGKFY